MTDGRVRFLDSLRACGLSINSVDEISDKIPRAPSGRGFSGSRLGAGIRIVLACTERRPDDLGAAQMHEGWAKDVIEFLEIEDLAELGWISLLAGSHAEGYRIRTKVSDSAVMVTRMAGTFWICPDKMHFSLLQECSDGALA